MPARICYQPLTRKGVPVSKSLHFYTTLQSSLGMFRKAYETSYKPALMELLKRCKELCSDREREKQHNANFCLSKSEARARNYAVQASSVHGNSLLSVTDHHTRIVWLWHFSASTSRGIYPLNTSARRNGSSPSGHPEGRAGAAAAPGGPLRPRAPPRDPPAPRAARARRGGGSGARTRVRPARAAQARCRRGPRARRGRGSRPLPPCAGRPRERAGVAGAARWPPAAVRGAEGCDAHGGGGGVPPAPAGRRPRARRRLPGRGVSGAAPAERCAG
ncbi:uncharacterized protein ACIQIH_013910 [Cyanocitta cristata]